MKTTLFVTMAAAAMIMAGCSSDEIEVDNWNGEIRLSSGLEVQQLTRSIATGLQNTQIESGLKVGFFINEDVASGATATTAYPQNLEYTADGNGGFGYGDKKVYYPQSGNGVNIYAYAPRKDALELTGTYDFAIQKDQSGNEGYLASDLLWGQPMKQTSAGSTTYETANPVARTKDNVNVTFKHLLAKVQVKLIPDTDSGLNADDFKDAKLEILGVKPGVSLNLADGKINDASGDLIDVTAATYPKDGTLSADGLTAAAIIVPQAFTSSTKFMKVTLATGGELFYTLDQDLTLKSGYIYKYDITVKLTGLKVTSSVEPWATIGSGDPVKGDAVMD